MPFGTSEMSAFFLRNSREYLQGYEEGYEQAKAEMRRALKKMEALTTSTNTLSVE